MNPSALEALLDNKLKLLTKKDLKSFRIDLNRLKVTMDGILQRKPSS